MSTIFKALADPTRRQILQLLKAGPMGAGEIADHFPTSKSTLSAHFAVLREAGLVGSEKSGKNVAYWLNATVLEEALLTLASALDLNVAPRGAGTELKPAEKETLMTMAPTDPTLADRSLIDLGPYFGRYDRRNRLVLGAALVASLALSAVVALRLSATGSPGPAPVAAVWVMGVVFPPVVIVAWWTFAELMALGRRKGARSDGSHPASAQDARNGMRIANAGFVYNLGLVVALLIEQLLMAAAEFRYPLPGVLIARAICVGVGAVTVYLGNLWPKMPIPRAPEQKAALKMRVNRVCGWVMVMFGLLIMIWGLVFPTPHPGLHP